MGYPRSMHERWDKIAAALTARGEAWTEDMIALDLDVLAERGPVPGERAAAERWCLRSRGNPRPGSGIYEARTILAAWRDERQGTSAGQQRLPSERAPRHDAPAWWDVWRPARAALTSSGSEFPVPVAAFDLFWLHNQRRYKGVELPGVSQLARLYGWVNDGTPARGRVQRMLDGEPWGSWDGLRGMSGTDVQPAPDAERAESRRHRQVVVDGVVVEVEPLGFTDAVALLTRYVRELPAADRRLLVGEAANGTMPSRFVTAAVTILKNSGLAVSRRRTDVIRFLAAAATESWVREAG